MKIVDMYDINGVGGRFRGFRGAKPEPKDRDIKTKDFYVYKRLKSGEIVKTLIKAKKK